MTSQDITPYQNYDRYFDAFSRHFFNKPYEMLDNSNKRSIDQLADKYGSGIVASMLYQTMARDRHADKDDKLQNPIAYLTALLKEINDDEIQYPMIDDPPENVEALIDGFDYEDMESYEYLLREHEKDMVHLALQVAVKNATTNLFGYTRRVLDDWRMRHITTPEKVHHEITRQRKV
jgi:DnaD/phage-associated family protein